MSRKLKQLGVSVIVLLMVITFMPAAFYDAFTARAETGKVEKIEKFSAKLVRGAEEKDGKYVWTPTNSAKDHMFVYRISYAFSGVGELPKKSVKIRVPKKLIKNRKGDYADTFDVGVPEETDADDNDEFAYKAGTGDDKDYYIVYNNKEISAGQSGTIEVSYSTSERTFSYKDMAPSDTFKADVTVDNNGTQVTADTTADPVYINTGVSIVSTSKRVPDGYFYRHWQDKWGSKPSDADNYYYLEWEIKSYIREKSTQPYNFTLNDTFDNGDVVAYKFSGGDGWQKSNTQKDVIPASGDTYDERYDYVLTRHKKSDVDSKQSYDVYNHVTAVVDPVDQVDADTQAKSNASWHYDKPVYTYPTGHFYQNKFGLFFGPTRYVGNPEYWYTREFDSTDDTNAEGRQTVTEDSEDISDYTLTEFKDGDTDSISKLRYFTYVRGYPYPWTLPDGKTGSDPTDYGKEKVRYQLVDNTVSLNGTQLKKGDYEVGSLSFNVEEETAKFDDEELKFKVDKRGDFDENDVLSFYVQTGSNIWNKACDYNLKTGEFTNVNALYVSSTTPKRIYFTSGVTGYKVETENAHYFTQINTFPMITLKNSDTVKGIVRDQTKVRLDNKSTGKVFNHNGTELFSKDAGGFDYIMGIKRESQINKDVIGTRNNKKQKKYTVTWHITARETYRDNDGRHATGQNGGIYYDLAPVGSTFDLDSLEVRDDTTVLSDSDYTTEVKNNYKGTGRQLLIIRIKKPGTQYNFTVDTVHTWEDLKEHTFNLLNSVAYETGNSKIADGYEDTGGTGEDKETLKDLDPDTDAAKFIYSQDWKEADLVTSTTNGLNKKVKAAEDADYSYSTTTYPDDDYGYRIRYANDDETKSKNMIFFDSLENYTTPEGKSSDWHGTLKEVDTSSLSQDGIAPVVYYSSIENLDIYNHHDLDEVVNGQKVWKTASEFGDMSKAKAIAIDCRKAKDGSDFVLDKGKLISAKVYMHSPMSVAGKNAIAYNNIFIDRDQISNIGTVTNDLFHQDYTQLKYRVVANVPLVKTAASNPDQTIEGISFRLYGTSDYGDDIDVTAKSGSDGTLTFKRIPVGTYKLQELGGSDDWLVDHDTKTVRIDDTGAVTVSDLAAKDGVWNFPDSPRIHGDLYLVKKSKQRDKLAQKAITDIKGAGEGKTVTIDGKNFTIISINADQTKAELKPADGVKAGTDTPELNSLLLKTLATGNYEVSLKNNPQYNIPNVSFHLSGTSDYGNEVSMDGTTDATGRLVLKNIEKGTYTLRETKANADYILNTESYKVKVDDSGNAFIVNGAQEGNYYIVQNEPRYHDFSVRKVDAENTSSWLSGAVFRLQGVSDLGTSVDKTATSGDTGIAEFLDLEKGKYILTETAAPEKHQLDTKQHVITVTEYGDVLCDDLSMDSDGHLQFPDKRSLDGKIVITKKWIDSKSDADRPVPKVHLTTKEPWYEKQAYAVYDSKDQSFTFFRDAKGKYTDGQVDGTKTYYTGFEDITGKTAPSWYDSSSYKQKNTIKTVVFKDKIQPKTCYDWFSAAGSLTSITGLDKLDTENVTNMSYMFDNCKSLASLDVSSFNTANVTNMHYMFQNCSSLTSLDLSSFNTEKVTDMEDMFAYCSKLTSLDLSSFNTGKVTNMKNMFNYCSKLTSLDLRNFNTENVTNMYSMFYYCLKLTDLDLSSFNTKNVTDMNQMFYDCQTLTNLNLSSFNTENVTNMSSMFYGCLKLTDLDVSSFNTANVTDMSSMFSSCDSLTSLNVSHFNTKSVTDMGHMFNYCSSLTSLDLSNFNTGNVTNMYCMFQFCSKLTSLDLSNFNTANVTDMSSMFYSCSKLKTIYASSSFTANASLSSYAMFTDCTSLVGGAGTKYNSNYVRATYARIDGGTSNPGYFTAKTAGAKAAVLDLSDTDSSIASAKSLLTGSLASANSLLKASENGTLTNSASALSNASAQSIAKSGAKKTVLRAAASSGTVTKYSHTPNISDDGTQNGNYANNLSTNDVVTIPGASKLHVKVVYGGESANWDWLTVWQGAHKDYTAAKDYSKGITDAQKLGGGSHTSSSNVKEFDVTGDSVTFGFKSDGSGYGDGYGYYAVVTGTPTQAYAVFDSSDGSLTFFRDTKSKYTNKQVDGTKTYYTGFEEATGTLTPSWSEKESQIKTVKFNDTIAPKTTCGWFAYAQNLTSITNLSKLDTSAVTDMRYMFEHCSGLTSLDLSSFNTSTVTDMQFMFDNCTGLTNLNLSSFDTSAVTNMWNMFYNCTGLTSLNLSSFDTSAVTNMDSMFRNCTGLTSLDLSSFDTSAVTNMSGMFSYCYRLSSLNVSSFNTSAVTDMGSMFEWCSGVKSLDLSGFNTKNVTNMYGMFSDCYSLKSLDLRSFDTSKVTNRKNMFYHDAKYQYYLQSLVLGEKFTKTSDDTGLTGNWQRIATASGRKVAKAAAISGSTLMSTYDGSTMNGVWLKEGASESASPVELYEDYVTDDSKWVKNGDGTWTYTFDVYDDTAKFYAYEENLTGYTSSNDEDNQLVINGGKITKAGTITNTSSDVGNLKISKTVAGDSLDSSDTSRKFTFMVKLTGTQISGTQTFGGVVFTDGTAQIALASGESKEFTDIPAGTTYAVTETPNDLYTQAETNGSGTITAGKTADVQATNTKIVDKTKLVSVKIAKVLTGTDTSADDVFSFTAELTGLVPQRTYALTNADNTTTTYTADLIGNAKITFTMKGGDTKTLTDLPAGATYRITEEKNAYTPTYKIVNADASGSIKQEAGGAKANTDLSTSFETADQGEQSTVTFMNEKNRDTSDYRSLVVVKKANDSSGNATDTVLPGAWFNLSGTSDDGEDIDISRETDSNGKLTFSKIYAGTYTLTEKQAPNGYQKDETARKVVIDPSKSSNEDITIENVKRNTDGSFSLYNNPVPTFPVSFSKKDFQNADTYVKNAVLAVYDSDGNRVEKWTTDGTDYTGKYPAGTYTLRELSAPDGYKKADDITFTIASDGTVTTSKTGALTSKDSTYTITMYDTQSVDSLPLTGGMSTKLLYLLGALLVCAGVAVYIRRKNKIS